MLEPKNENQKLVNEFFDKINVMGGEKEMANDILEVINHSHRTLVQTFFRIMKIVISEYAKTQFFDPRNEGSVKWAKKVSEVDESLPFI